VKRVPRNGQLIHEDGRKALSKAVKKEQEKPSKM